MDDPTETFLVSEEYLAQQRHYMVVLGGIIMIPLLLATVGWPSGAHLAVTPGFLRSLLFPVVVLPVIIRLQYYYMLEHWRGMKLHIGPDGIVREADEVREVVPWERITRVRTLQNPRGEVRAVEVSAAGHPTLMLVGFAPMADVAEKIRTRVPPTARVTERRDAVDVQNPLLLVPFMLSAILVVEALHRLGSRDLNETISRVIPFALVILILVRRPSSRTNPNFRGLEVVIATLLLVSVLAGILTPRIRHRVVAPAQHPGHAGAILTMAYSPDGRTLASGSADKTVKLWAVSVAGPVPTLKLIQTLSGHEDAIQGLAFSRDGSKLATASSDRTVRLWDANTWQLKAVLEGHKRGVASVLFSPDGRTLASAGIDGSVNLWRADPPGLMHTFTGEHKRGLPDVRFSPESRTVTVTYYDRHGSTVLLWDIPRRKMLREACGPSYAPDLVRYFPWRWTFPDARSTSDQELARHLPWRFTISADDKKIAAGNSGGIVIVAARPRGLELRTSDPLQRQRPADMQPVKAIAFSHDGHLLATLGEDRKVVIWSVEAPRQLKVLTGRDLDIAPYPYSLVFSPDDSTLAIEDKGRAPKLWKLAAIGP